MGALNNKRWLLHYVLSFYFKVCHLNTFQRAKKELSFSLPLAFQCKDE